MLVDPDRKTRFIEIVKRLKSEKLDEEKDVSLQFKWDRETLELEVTDQGKGFDFDHVPDPTEPTL